MRPIPALLAGLLFAPFVAQAENKLSAADYAEIQQLVNQLKAIHPYELPAFYTVATSPQTHEWDHWVNDQCNTNRP